MPRALIPRLLSFLSLRNAQTTEPTVAFLQLIGQVSASQRKIARISVQYSLVKRDDRTDYCLYKFGVAELDISANFLLLILIPRRLQ